MVRRVGPTVVALGFRDGHSIAEWLPLQLVHWCVYRHPKKEHLFQFHCGMAPPECSRSRNFVGPAEAGHVKATSTNSMALRRLSTSESASDARLQSSGLWITLRQRSHLLDHMALPVKQIAYSDRLIRNQSIYVCMPHRMPPAVHLRILKWPSRSQSCRP